MTTVDVDLPYAEQQHLHCAWMQVEDASSHAIAPFVPEKVVYSRSRMCGIRTKCRKPFSRQLNLSKMVSRTERGSGVGNHRIKFLVWNMPSHQRNIEYERIITCVLNQHVGDRGCFVHDVHSGQGGDNTAARMSYWNVLGQTIARKCHADRIIMSSTVVIRVLYNFLVVLHGTCFPYQL